MNWTGEQIKEFRKKRKLSQTKFGVELGTNASQISRWEKERQIPGAAFCILLDLKAKEHDFIK